MLRTHPNRGDLIKVPQGTIMYRATQQDPQEINLVFAEETKKPSIAIFIEDFNERVSKLIVEDNIRYVYSEWLFNLEDANVCEINDDSRRNYQF